MIFYARCDGVLGLVSLQYWLKSMCEGFIVILRKLDQAKHGSQ
jgi:hypothetical protein